MLLTLELPIHQVVLDLGTSYESRLGAQSDWLDELPRKLAKSLLHLALRRGTPLVLADLEC